MGFLSRIGSWVVPRHQANWLAVRQAQMAYDAATTGRRAQGWRVVSTDANSEMLGANSRIRDVARDMVRNSPLANRAKQVIVHNVVGKGIIPTIAANSEVARRRLEEVLKAHFDTTACDATGKHDLYGLQSLAMGTIVESGEVLIRRRPRRAEDRLPLPFQLQVMEPDFIDSTITGPQPSGNFAVQGIEYDFLGRIVFYHLFPEHPGSMATFTMQASQRVPAENIAHVFMVNRPGQARGVSWFAPVVLRMRDRADFADAHLMRQKIAACFAAFIRSPEGDGITEDEDQTYPLEAIEPGMIERLSDGEDVTFGNPPQVGDYGEYVKAQDREIAAGLGISYEALTGDLSNVNFSSGRMGWLEFQRSIDSWRDHMLKPQMLATVGKWFIDAAAASGYRTLNAKVMWTEPRREMISPKDEVPAIRDAMLSGLTSWSHEVKKQGFDPDDLMAEIEADMKRFDAAGVQFDSDPRKAMKVAEASKPEPAAAPEEDNQERNGDGS